MSAQRTDFRALQRAFTAHIRDPERHPAPADVEDRRMAVYRELLYNNVERFLGNSYPVLRKLLPDPTWHALVRDFFIQHRARTPLFPKLAQEFLHHLTARDPASLPLPFMCELAHYECLEAEVMLDKREIGARTDVEDILDGVPVLNPLARIHGYAYPVHRIAPNFQPQEPSTTPTYLVVFRDRGDDVGFMELNPVTARLLELVARDEDRTSRSLLEQIAAEMNHSNPEVVVAGGADMLRDLVARCVISGFKAKPATR